MILGLFNAYIHDIKVLWTHSMQQQANIVYCCVGHEDSLLRQAHITRIHQLVHNNFCKCYEPLKAQFISQELTSRSVNIIWH